MTEVAAELAVFVFASSPTAPCSATSEGKPLRVDPPARAFLPHVNAVANATVTPPAAEGKPSGS